MALVEPMRRMPLVRREGEAHITAMATRSDTITSKSGKAGVLGRSAATGRYVLAPVATKKATVSDQRIAAAVKSVLAKKK
ncbi:hypothetical protein [Sphingomonas aquatilis]